MGAQWWAITDRASGELQYAVTAGDRPAYAAAGFAVVAIEREPTPDDSFDGRKLSLDLGKLRARLLVQVDAQREDQRRPVMTQLLGQSHVYSEKSREVVDYRSTLANALAALTMPALKQRFPFAMAEAEATGDALATVIARFEAGAASRNRVAAIDALATRAKRAIRAATTREAIVAAAVIDWRSPS